MNYMQAVDKIMETWELNHEKVHEKVTVIAILYNYNNNCKCSCKD